MLLDFFLLLLRLWIFTLFICLILFFMIFNFNIFVRRISIQIFVEIKTLRALNAIVNTLILILWRDIGLRFPSLIWDDLYSVFGCYILLIFFGSFFLFFLFIVFFFWIFRFLLVAIHSCYIRIYLININMLFIFYNLNFFFFELAWVVI